MHFVGDAVAAFRSASAWLAGCIASIERARRYDPRNDGSR